MAVDTHCHLFLINTEPERAVETARLAGVDKLVCVGIDPRSSRESLDLARRFPGAVFATAGLHPHEASDLDGQARGDIETLAADPLVVGIGETGLDFYRMKSPAEDQEGELRFHAALSRDSGKPLVVHVREAWDRTLTVLDEEHAANVVLHCFSGDEIIAVECISRGFRLSFAGPVTYPKNDSLRAAASVVPADRLLIETDSPYLPPQHLRGHDNTPENVLFVAQTLAEAREETLESVIETTTANAEAAFPGL